MLRCFICKEQIIDANSLFDHLKKLHKLKTGSKFQCTVGRCRAVFANFSSFKRHVLNCVAKGLVDQSDSESNEGEESDTYIYSVDRHVLNFQKGMSTATLEFACCLCADMKTPRCDIYKIIGLVKKKLISRITSGIQDVFVSHIPTEETVNQFITAIESSFDDVHSECKLERALYELKVLAPIEKCEIFESFDNIQENSKRKPKKKKVTSGAALEVDGPKRTRELVDSDEDDDAEDDVIEETTDKETIFKGELTLMPIQFQLKKFLELPNVYEKIKMNTTKIQQGTDLDHFIKGKLWKEKIKNYKPDAVVIPFHFYGDGVQVNNALGPHAKMGEHQMYYFSLPTVPYEFQSRLDNIFIAQSYPASYHNIFTSEKLFNNIFDKFTILAEDGIDLNINGEELKVYFVCGLFIGDNKEQNQRLSYVGGFFGSHCCRFCQSNYERISTHTNASEVVRRNRKNYDEDVIIDNVTATGIHEDSPFNRIPYFHVTESSSVDLAHDLTEGTLHPSLARSILKLMDKKYFDLKYLNDQMASMDFGEVEKGNLPVAITKERLKMFKFKMSCSEMFFFAHHLTLMIGSRVPDDDPVWQHILTTIKFFDLSYLPKYSRNDLNALRAENDKFNKGMKDLFKIPLQPKAHNGTHYPELTEEFGPLRYVQTIRYEGKHKEMKSYAKNTNSRKNLSYSLALKAQFQFASRLLRREGLEDRIVTTKYKNNLLKDKVYYEMLPSLNESLLGECFFADKMTVNGIVLTKELWLPNFANSEPSIFEIVDILCTEVNDIDKIWVVCKKYIKVTYDNHYNCHMVHMDSLQEEMIIMNVNEYLLEHQYPVKIHFIEDKNLFRCKRF